MHIGHQNVGFLRNEEFDLWNLFYSLHWAPFIEAQTQQDYCNGGYGIWTRTPVYDALIDTRFDILSLKPLTKSLPHLPKRPRIASKIALPYAFPQGNRPCKARLHPTRLNAHPRRNKALFLAETHRSHRKSSPSPNRAMPRRGTCYPSQKPYF